MTAAKASRTSSALRRFGSGGVTVTGDCGCVVMTLPGSSFPGSGGGGGSAVTVGWGEGGKGGGAAGGGGRGGAGAGTVVGVSGAGLSPPDSGIPGLTGVSGRCGAGDVVVVVGVDVRVAHVGSTELRASSSI